MGVELASNCPKSKGYREIFVELNNPLNYREAKIAASRCYFCHDAPCINACPTRIDIPLFIRQILTDDLKGSATTIFSQNIMGGMCARVCPTEQLCEEACIRNHNEDKPVEIGRLQRYSTDYLIDKGCMPFTCAKSNGKKVCVVGAGPAGLSCAHRLATLGYQVDIFDANEKPGGLNEYGIAAYKTTNNFAQKEINYILSIGGITTKNGIRLGKDQDLTTLQKNYDAVFLGIGMEEAKILGLPKENSVGVEDAIDYIRKIRQAKELSELPIGKRIVVIGGGMTSIDIAIQAKRLGAEEVIIAYRRGPEHMKASIHQREIAQTSGVTIKYWVKPKQLHVNEGKLNAIEFEYSKDQICKFFTLEADTIFIAIGQQISQDIQLNLKMKNGRISVDQEKRTSIQNIWAGGDCVNGGLDLTVDAIEDGKIAAESIHRELGNIM